MESSNQLTVFRHEGVDIRIATADGEPWWIAADVAKALGYSATAAMTRSLDDDEKGVRTLHTPGGEQEMVVISEAGLYSAILRSTLQSAKDFKRWVTHEVLPQIRRTGSFTAPAPVERALPQSFSEALRQLAAEVESHETTKAELEAATPRAEAWDAIASAHGDYSVGDAAKILARAGIPTGPQRLVNQLISIRWVYRDTDGRLRPYADRIDRGYLAQKPQFHYHPGTGERVIDAPQVRVTVKGLERLRQRLHVGSLKAVSA